MGVVFFSVREGERERGRAKERRHSGVESREAPVRRILCRDWGRGLAGSRRRRRASGMHVECCADLVLTERLGWGTCSHRWMVC
jgi:hypothetical protein